MKIAIDIDDVVVGFFENYMKFIETKGVKRVPYGDICCSEMWKVFGISKELVLELADEYHSCKYFDEVEFIEGAKDGVCFLRDNFDIVFVTARPKVVHKKTKDFIFEKFGLLGNKVVFSGNSFYGGVSKCEICKELGIGLIIEDNGHDSLKYAKNGMKVLLLDKPWNQGIEHERIFRCKDWGEVLVKVEEVKDGE